MLHSSESAIRSPVFSVARLLDGCECTVGVHMAAARAVSQFADGVENPGAIHLLVWTGFIVARVATGAIRFIRCVWPRYGLAVPRMTRQTGRIPVMGARIASRRVGETDGCPASRVVAGITLQ